MLLTLSAVQLLAAPGGFACGMAMTGADGTMAGLMSPATASGPSAGASLGEERSSPSDMPAQMPCGSEDGQRLCVTSGYCTAQAVTSTASRQIPVDLPASVAFVARVEAPRASVACPEPPPPRA